jgi:hypothetical protein
MFGSEARLVGAAAKKSIYIWDVGIRRLARQFSFSPDGKRSAIGGAGATHLFDVGR